MSEEKMRTYSVTGIARHGGKKLPGREDIRRVYEWSKRDE